MARALFSSPEKTDNFSEAAYALYCQGHQLAAKRNHEGWNVDFRELIWGGFSV